MSTTTLPVPSSATRIFFTSMSVSTWMLVLLTMRLMARTARPSGPLPFTLPELMCLAINELIMDSAAMFQSWTLISPTLLRVRVLAGST